MQRGRGSALARCRARDPALSYLAACLVRCLALPACGPGRGARGRHKGEFATNPSLRPGPASTYTRSYERKPGQHGPGSRSSPFVQLTTKEDCQTLGVTVLVLDRRRSSVEATCSHPGDHPSTCVPRATMSCTVARSRPGAIGQRLAALLWTSEGRICAHPDEAPVMTDRNVMRPGRPQIRPRHSRRREPSQGGCRSLRACLPLVPGMFVLWLPLA